MNEIQWSTMRRRNVAVYEKGRQYRFARERFDRTFREATNSMLMFANTTAYATKAAKEFANAAYEAKAIMNRRRRVLQVR